jgi:ATP-dependent DNA ligase
MGAGWTHEVKQGGYRIIARRVGAAVRLWSRNAADHAGTMTRIVAGLRKLRVKSCTINGEANVFRPADPTSLPCVARKGRGAPCLSTSATLCRLKPDTAV